METIQVVLDAKLLREHLKRMAIRQLEDRDRKGYADGRETPGEWSVWEAEAVWPA